MRRQQIQKKGPKPSTPAHQPKGSEERARDLLIRLETEGPNPVQAAEELDRLQAAMERAGKLDTLRDAVADLCEAWADSNLRGDRGRAWLSLVGSFGLDEHADRVAGILTDSGLPPALRVPAARVLARFKGDEAVHALMSVVLASSEAQVRAAAAEALADVGDRSVRPDLEALLEEDLPRNVWQAVGAAVDRLR